MPPSSFDVGAPAKDSKWSEGRRDKKRPVSSAKPTETEAAQAQRKAALAKSKRDNFSTRNILNQIDGAEDEAPAAPVANKKRTVYAPQHGNRKRDLKRRKDLKKTQITTPKASLRVVKMGSEITVSELANVIVKAGEIIKKLMGDGVMATINQNSFDTASLSRPSTSMVSNLVSLDDILAKKKDAYQSADQQERPRL